MCYIYVCCMLYESAPNRCKFENKPSPHVILHFLYTRILQLYFVFVFHMFRSRQCGGGPPGKHARHANSILPTTACIPVHKRCPGIRILIYLFIGTDISCYHGMELGKTPTLPETPWGQHTKRSLHPEGSTSEISLIYCTGSATLSIPAKRTRANSLLSVPTCKIIGQATYGCKNTRKQKIGRHEKGK